MTRQRRRGQSIIVYPRMKTIDGRGNEYLTPDLSKPRAMTAAVVPQRSSKAEIPGQQQIDVVRLIVDPDLAPDVGLWGRVHYAGEDWDIAAPPAYHHGSRGTRHWSIDIRRRPV